MSKRIALVFLIASIVVAVFVRNKHMDNEVRTWQVGNTIMLTTLEIWHKEGITKHHFSPIQTWPNAGDRFHHLYKRLEDKHGNNYYVSLPPMAWWLAHAVFKASSKPPSQIGLQIIGLILQLLGAFAVFGFLFSYFKSWSAAVVGFIIFLFYPVLAFGFNYNFFSEIIGLTFWALSAYMAIRSLNKPVTEWPWLLATANLLFVLTCWTGVFFSFAAIVFFLVHKRWKTTTLIGASALLGICIIILCYGSIAGFEELWNSWRMRFYERSGIFEKHLSDRGLNILNPTSYRLVLDRFLYHMQWLGYASFLVITSALVWMKMTKEHLEKAATPKAFAPLLFLLLVPAVMHLMVFLNANALHYIYQGKWALVIAMLSGWVIYRLGAYPSKYAQTIGLSIIFVGLIFSLEIKTPEDTESEKVQALADQLRPTLQPNNPVIIEAGNGINTLYLSYLLKRNVIALEKAEQDDGE